MWSYTISTLFFLSCSAVIQLSVSSLRSLHLKQETRDGRHRLWTGRYSQPIVKVQRSTPPNLYDNSLNKNVLRGFKVFNGIPCKAAGPLEVNEHRCAWNRETFQSIQNSSLNQFTHLSRKNKPLKKTKRLPWNLPSRIVIKKSLTIFRLSDRHPPLAQNESTIEWSGKSPPERLSAERTQTPNPRLRDGPDKQLNNMSHVTSSDYFKGRKWMDDWRVLVQNGRCKYVSSRRAGSDPVINAAGTWEEGLVPNIETATTNIKKKNCRCIFTKHDTHLGINAP